MSPKKMPVPVKVGAEVGAVKVVGVTSRKWFIFILGILLIIIGIAMLQYDWVGIFVCFLTSGWIVIAIGFFILAIGLLVTNLSYPTALTRVILAGIFGLIALILFIINFFAGVN